MGNRAIVIFSNAEFTEFSPAIYLHWNGGPESVYQFLDELDRRQCRADQEYEAARFVQIVGEFMDQDYRTTLSLGISNGPKTLKEAGEFADLYGTDNGVYVVARRDGFKPIVKRFQRKWTDVDNKAKVYQVSDSAVASEERAARKHEYTKDGGFRACWGDKPTEAENRAKAS